MIFVIKVPGSGYTDCRGIAKFLCAAFENIRIHQNEPSVPGLTVLLIYPIQTATHGKFTYVYTYVHTHTHMHTAKTKLLFEQVFGYYAVGILPMLK